MAVDDEPFALEILKSYCDKIPNVGLKYSFANPLEAIHYIKNDPPDFILMDINMPDINGIQLVKMFPDIPPIIFTTAHSGFAVESYNISAVDYLLKPFDLERFNQAIVKVRKHIALTKLPSLQTNREAIQIKVEYKNVKIFHDDILYIQAMDNYVKIYTSSRFYLTQQSMKGILDNLPQHRFCRVHKSFIVSIDKVSNYSTKTIQIGSVTLPIGRKFKEAFLAYCK
ncbi:LytR/AlgR family response regulator transcription factor [Sediminicola luteus]|nr:LytTR family DNA-binding domain-containing protein [Sediminicola luteus]